MTRKQLKVIILGSFCVLGILISIPGFMINAQKSNISSVESALLNPKYAAQVNIIAFSFPDGCELQFEKQMNRLGNEIWTGRTDEGTVFTANSTMMEQLVSHAAETRSMAQVSDSFTAWAALGLADDNAVNISFSHNDNDGSTTTFSSLYFGYQNADATMLYVRNDRKSNSWRIQDDFSSYLTDSISFWADQRLLPIGSSSETDDSRAFITIQTTDDTRTLINNVDSGTGFDDTVHTLLSLRSSELLSFADFQLEAPQAREIMKITLSASDASTGAYGFTVYEAVFEDGIEYYVRNFGILSATEAPYLLQISEWTLNRISETLGF